MKMEARVVCVGNKVRIQDLMLNLHRGEVEYVPEARARASADLTEAERQGLVAIEYIQRFREVRAHAKQTPARENSVAWNRPPQRLLRRGAPIRQKATPPTPPPTPKPAPAVDEGAVRAIVAEELRAQLQGMKKDLIGHLVAHMDDLRQDVRVLFERSLSGVVEEVVSGVETHVSSLPTVAVSAAPLPRIVEAKTQNDGWGFEDEEDPFIPQGIINKSGPSLEVESEVSETPAELEDAANALRLMKKRNKAASPSGQEEKKK